PAAPDQPGTDQAAGATQLLHRRVVPAASPDQGSRRTATKNQMGEFFMRRRDLLQSALAGTVTGLAAPYIARGADAKVLRFLPQANLANLDPIWTTLYVVRNANVLFWDTLYGVDSTLTPRPQMCEGHDVDSEGLTCAGSVSCHPG